MLHHPVHAATLILNPTFSYSYNVDFDGKVREGFLTCLPRMVPNQDAHRTIIQEMQAYSGIFGFDTIVQENKFLMPSKSLELRMLITNLI